MFLTRAPILPTFPAAVRQDTILIRVVPSEQNSFAERFEHSSWLLGTVIGLIALVISYRALKLQATLPGQERRNARYRALVVDRVVHLVAQFEERAAKQILGTVAELSTLKANGTVPSVLTARLREFSDGYREGIQPLSFKVLGALQAWGDKKLVAHAAGVLENLEDLNEHVEAAILRPQGREQLSEEFHAQCALLLAAIVRGMGDD